MADHSGDPQAVANACSNDKAAIVQPIIGNDGKLLGLTVNGVVCVRPPNISFEQFAESMLLSLTTYPRDKESRTAKKLIESDDERIGYLKNVDDPSFIGMPATPYSLQLYSLKQAAEAIEEMEFPESEEPLNERTFNDMTLRLVRMAIEAVKKQETWFKESLKLGV